MISRLRYRFAAAAAAAVVATALGQSHQLPPLPDHGPVPPTIAAQVAAEPSPDLVARNGKLREYRRQIRRIVHENLGGIKVAAKRQQGIAELRGITDPMAFPVLSEELTDQKDDVRFALLDHFAEQGDPGQAALARMAIHDTDDGLRREAAFRMHGPASPSVLGILDEGLRSPLHRIANNAGALAGTLNAIETIPLLIFAQVTGDPVPDDSGDLAWILVGTQKAYVAEVYPVVGDGAAAFVPVPGVVQEGSIMRVVDAVVVIYRTQVHRSLVAMTTRDWGQPTDRLGYDPRAWWAWYNEQYVPFHNERAQIRSLAALPGPVPGSTPAGAEADTRTPPTPPPP